MESLRQLLEYMNTEPWGSSLRAGLLKLTGAILIVLIGLWLARRLARTAEKLLLKAKVDSMLAGFTRNVVRVLLVVVVLIAALDAIGVPATSLFAIVGAAGLAVALALKDSLGNLAAGVTLILLRPFRSGDAVEICGLIGKVEQIRLMHTVLVAADNRELILPNGKVVNEAIINHSARPTRRVDLDVGIAYGDDVAGAAELILKILQDDARVLVEPAATVVLNGLGESSVDLSVRPWAQTADYWALRSDLLREIKRGLEGAGYSIPFPQRDLHIVASHSAPAA